MANPRATTNATDEDNVAIQMDLEPVEKNEKESIYNLAAIFGLPDKNNKQLNFTVENERIHEPGNVLMFGMFRVFQLIEEKEKSEQQKTQEVKNKLTL